MPNNDNVDPLMLTQLVRLYPAIEGTEAKWSFVALSSRQSKMANELSRLVDVVQQRKRDAGR